MQIKISEWVYNAISDVIKIRLIIQWSYNDII
jgi:hypothetical protein